MKSFSDIKIKTILGHNGPLKMHTLIPANKPFKK
jgi:hypothetical protein